MCRFTYGFKHIRYSFATKPPPVKAAYVCCHVRSQWPHSHGPLTVSRLSNARAREARDGFGNVDSMLLRLEVKGDENQLKCDTQS